MCNKKKGYVLGTQYPAKINNMQAKIQKLLPAPKLIPSEWASIEAYLKDCAEVKKGKEVYFSDGYAFIEKVECDDYQPNWHNYDLPEPETVNIRDLEVDQSLVRYYLQSIENPKEFFEADHAYPRYTIKEFVSDGIIELQFLFTQEALKY